MQVGILVILAYFCKKYIQMSAVLNPSLSNAQLELLKLFSRDFSGTELLELKRILVKFLAQKAIRAANETMDEKGWGQDDLDQLLHTHERTPYPSK